MATQDVTTLLAETWFAGDLTPEARGRLAALGYMAEFPEGLTVIQEGAACRSLGVVISGRIALRLSLPGGDDRTILTVHPGDVFGWSSVLPQPVATSTAVAVQPTAAVMFDGGQLKAALASDRDLAAAIYGRLLVSVARRLMATRVQLLDLYRPGNQPW